MILSTTKLSLVIHKTVSIAARLSYELYENLSSRKEETGHRLGTMRKVASRCAWANNDPLLQRYHDEEWGVPEKDSRALWETLMLEGFQAGLSWTIILRKREAFRKAFKGFDPNKVACFGEAEIERLLNDPGIVRSRAKIEATITGARIFLQMQAAGEDFADYVWGWVGGKPIQNANGTIPASTPLSGEISKMLKKRGFKFVGPTIVYAWMQAVGLVNDHSPNCFLYREFKP